MAEDVIDIRKRIEEIRNEVSTAISTGQETVIASRPAGDVAEFSVPGVTNSAAAVRRAEPDVQPDSKTLTETNGALDEALKLPSFQLNVRNQGPNKLLMFLVGTQLVTNIALITVIWLKLG